MINLEDYLTIVAAYIRRDGYVKSVYQYPTWEKAFVRYETPEKSDNIQITYDDKKLANDTMLYFIKQKNINNDYVKKVQDILVGIMRDKKKIEKRDLPFLASAVQSCIKNREFLKRKEEEKKQKEQEAKSSNYVGNVGDKITVPVVKMFSKYIETRFGGCMMYRFTDKDGNIFLWFTGREIPDSVTEISGTVKSHEEYQGIKQTILTRCKFK